MACPHVRVTRQRRAGKTLVLSLPSRPMLCVLVVRSAKGGKKRTRVSASSESTLGTWPGSLVPPRGPEASQSQASREEYVHFRYCLKIKKQSHDKTSYPVIWRIKETACVSESDSLHNLRRDASCFLMIFLEIFMSSE